MRKLVILLTLFGLTVAATDFIPNPASPGGLGNATNQWGYVWANQLYGNLNGTFAGGTNGITTDFIDAYDIYAYSLSAATMKQLVGSPDTGATALTVLVTPTTSEAPFFRNWYGFFSAGPAMTNFNYGVTFTCTNKNWQATNDYYVAFMTNGPGGSIGRYLALSKSAVAVSGLGTNFVSTNFLFSVPYTILTNSVAIEGTFYDDNWSTNEFLLRMWLQN